MDSGKLGQQTEFLWRRLVEDCPDWTVGVPVAFGALVVLLIALFRHERRLAALLWGLAIVGAIALLYVPLALMLKPMFSWLVVLVPVMAVALFYVGLMYVKDAKSIHPAWASFLGLLRCAVYGILAAVFLLPGCQTYEETVSHAKVLFLFDVSGSMFTVDDLPEVGQDPAKLPTRQDKIVRFLTARADLKGQAQTPFLDRVLARTPVDGFRFGAALDETQVQRMQEGRAPTPEALAAWLKPSRTDVTLPDGIPEGEKAAVRAKMLEQTESLLSGTNYGGSVLQALKLDNNSFLQAVVVIGDGQNNAGSDEALKEVLARANSPKRTVPVFTIGVGEYRQPASIRIDDLQAPETTRPDDKFPIRIPVVGTGLVDEEFTVHLDLKRVKDGTGKPVEEKGFALEPRKGKFKGAGDNPMDTVEYEIDVQALKGIKVDDDKNGDLEGTYQVVARVPRHPREPFPKAEHVTEPIEVQVQKKKLRVLLFAGGPTREYQFVRSLLYREVIAKRAELTVHLQTGSEDNVDQDVEKERLLTQFPDRLGPDDGKHMSLNDYDVIVAFDPDWTALTPQQLGVVKEWVGTHSGGIIFVAGPVYTYHLARPAGRDLSALLTLYPVVPKDSRLHGLGLAAGGHDASRPYVLNFTPAAKNFDFLKLDEAAEEPTAGWDKFFWGAGAPPEAGKDVRPRRGFYNYYPVDRIKPDSAVVATFGGPRESRINDGKDEQPYMVSMRYGNGKTLYLGSGELWRLRQAKDGYHERLWIKMARYVSAGATQQKKYGRIILARSVPTGTLAFEAQVKGKDLMPLPKDARPTVFVRRLDKEGQGEDGKGQARETFDLRAKPTDGDWQGYFIGSYQLKEPGEYEFRIPVANTSESLSHRLTVRRPNPELDNVRTNFGYLYQMASEAGPALARLNLPPDVRKEVERSLAPPSGDEREGKESVRLFFPLAAADAVAKCLNPVPPKREAVKGPLLDLWDQGVETGYEVDSYWLGLGLPIAIGLLGAAILLFMGQYSSAGLFFGGGVVLSLGVLLPGLALPGLSWPALPVDMSFVLVTVVSLLGVEWLTRKLLRLA